MVVMPPARVAWRPMWMREVTPKQQAEADLQGTICVFSTLTRLKLRYRRQTSGHLLPSTAPQDSSAAAQPSRTAGLSCGLRLCGH